MIPAKYRCLKQRRSWEDSLGAGSKVEIPRMRVRELSGREWWQQLTLDPASLSAAWARPRPLRERPAVGAYKAALFAVRPTESEHALLRVHAKAPKQSMTMRELARLALRSDSPGAANLGYGKFAHRVAQQLNWEPDRRKDGKAIWMSAIAEDWHPHDGEWEMVMIRSLGLALEQLGWAD